METFGPWCEEAKEFVMELRKFLIRESGDSKSGSYLIQRIGIAIQRGNAISVMGTFESGECDVTYLGSF